MKMCLGLDTSCYTTSVALCGAECGMAEGPFFQERKLLTVPEGERGLMQSEMAFQHVTRLPALVESLLAEHKGEVVAVCASTRPRPAEDSYMPVFRVGEGTGRAVAAGLGVPFFETTHQEGHIRAARVGTQLAADAPYLALHLSGGTTEALCVADGRVHWLGGTKDLHAGQLIDRIGVAMGLGFPAGPALERLAAQGSAAQRLPASVTGMDCHFSGAEAQALRWLQSGALCRQDVAAEVFACIARTVSKLIVAASAHTGVSQVLLGGGVASSQLLRDMITQRVAARAKAVCVHFGRPELSGDNAVGIAFIGMERIWQQKGKEHGSTNH